MKTQTPNKIPTTPTSIVSSRKSSNLEPRPSNFKQQNDPKISKWNAETPKTHRTSKRSEINSKKQNLSLKKSVQQPKIYDHEDGSVHSKNFIINPEAKSKRSKSLEATANLKEHNSRNGPFVPTSKRLSQSLSAFQTPQNASLSSSASPRTSTSKQRNSNLKQKTLYRKSKKRPTVLNNTV